MTKTNQPQKVPYLQLKAVLIGAGEQGKDKVFERTFTVEKGIWRDDNTFDLFDVSLLINGAFLEIDRTIQYEKNCAEQIMAMSFQSRS